MGLEIKKLSKKYGDFQVLKDVNLTLENGVYGLLGPNGAGKSTLIHLITDNVSRDQGEILWNGEEILHLGANYRNELGYMPQQQGYYEDFSAGAFLMYMAYLKGMKKTEAKKRVSELLSIVSLEECRKKKIGTFSGGMKQRLLIAQALLNDPKLLILDEPTAGVDPQERIRIRNFISEIAADRIVILATHIVSDVEAIAKEIILLRNGEILKKGTPYELLEEMKSYLYEMLIPQDQLDKIQQKYVVSNIRQENGKLAVKIISEEPPKEHAWERPLANLEDVYLYYFTYCNS